MFAHAKKAQKQEAKSPARKKEPEKAVAAPNQTGIPDAIKAHFESASGFSFDDVRVHYNSGKPAQLQALAYTQGNQVYLGPGQQKHLRHELGHVVQQKEGRVKATANINGFAINDDIFLENEASSYSSSPVKSPNSPRNPSNGLSVIQGVYINYYDNRAPADFVMGSSKKIVKYINSLGGGKPWRYLDPYKKEALAPVFKGKITTGRRYNLKIGDKGFSISFSSMDIDSIDYKGKRLTSDADQKDYINILAHNSIFNERFIYKYTKETTTHVGNDYLLVFDAPYFTKCLEMESFDLSGVTIEVHAHYVATDKTLDCIHYKIVGDRRSYGNKTNAEVSINFFRRNPAISRAIGVAEMLYSAKQQAKKPK